jgi:hypothetical protein
VECGAEIFQILGIIDKLSFSPLYLPCKPAVRKHSGVQHLGGRGKMVKYLYRHQGAATKHFGTR